MTVTRCSTLNGKFSATRVYITSISSPCTDGDDAKYHDGRITTERHAEGEKRKKKKKKNENQKILTLGPLSPRTFDSSRSLRSSLFDTCSPRHQVHQERILDSLPSSRSTSHSKVLSTTVLIFTHNTRFINLHGDHFPYM